jgi:hypothetical protein
VAQRRFHYEQAFEHYLRSNRVPYVAVDEAKKALAPISGGGRGPSSLKSFDFVVYTPQRNLLIDVKGRMFGRGSAKPQAGGDADRVTRAASSGAGAGTGSRSGGRGGGGHYESWVTRDDVDCMEQWQQLFGEGFMAVFVFAYCLRQQPPDALFEEVFAFNQRWYALREVTLADYRRVMQQRSAKWTTVHVPAAAFAAISRPFSVRTLLTAVAP